MEAKAARVILWGTISNRVAFAVCRDSRYSCGQNHHSHGIATPDSFGHQSRPLDPVEHLDYG